MFVEKLVELSEDDNYGNIFRCCKVEQNFVAGFKNAPTSMWSLDTKPYGVHPLMNRNLRTATIMQKFFCLLKVLLLPRLETHGIVQNEKMILLRHEFIVNFAFTTNPMRYGRRDTECIVN